MHNGVKTEGFKEVMLEVSKRTDKTEINIGAIVRVVPIKDIITMLDAFSIVNQSIDNINFYIMGPTNEDINYYEECLRYKSILGLKNVEFTGTVNIKEYLKNMDLLVLTSISEGQPLVILEGLACKLPFVSTNVGDYKSLILGKYDDFGPAGKIANVMDSIGIAKGIIELCINKDLRIKYGDSGYKRVNHLYTFDGFINKYKELYQIYGRG